MNQIAIIIGVFLVGILVQIVLLQINLLQYHKKNPNTKYRQSRWIFRHTEVDEIILPELTEGMFLSHTILFGYLFLRYFTPTFSSLIEPNILHYVIPSFFVDVFLFLISFFFCVGIIVGSFNFRMPSFVKFINYCWFLVCSIMLFIFFTGKLYLYFQNLDFIFQDGVTMFFIGFNAIPLCTYVISIRWLFPNKNKSVIEQIGLMITKVDDKQFSWQRTLLIIGIQGGILLLNGFFKLLDDAAVVGTFLAFMPFLHYKKTKKAKTI